MPKLEVPIYNYLYIIVQILQTDFILNASETARHLSGYDIHLVLDLTIFNKY